MGLRNPATSRTLRSLVLKGLPILAALLALWGLQDRLNYPDPGLRLHSLRVLPGSDSPPEMRPGDRLLRVNGIHVRSDFQARSLMARQGLSGPLNLELERDGELLSLSQSVEALSPPRKGYWALRTLAGLLVFIVGFRVIQKRDDPLAQLFLLLCVLMGALLVPQGRALAKPIAHLLEWQNDLLSLLLPPLFLHFIILFPESRSRSPWLRTAIYLPTAVWILADAVAVFFLEYPVRLQYPLERIAGLHAALLMLITLGVLGFKTFRRGRRRERYRLRLVLLGGLLGLFPLLLFQVLHQLLPGQSLSASAVAPLFLVFAPLSFAYGILGRDLIALQRRADRTWRFMLQGGLFILLFMLLHALVLLLTGTPSRPMALYGQGSLSVLLALLIWFPFYRRLPWAARRQESEELPRLWKLLQDPQRQIHLGAFMQAMACPLCEDLESSWALWLSRGEEGWEERFRYVDPRAERTLPEAAGISKPMVMPGRLEKRLITEQDLLAAELWDPYWAASLLGPRALDFCQERDWSLLLSFPLERQPILLVLGPCRRSTLHSPRRVTRLQSLMPVLGLQVRNLSMVERLAREEVLDRELKLARQIQERILPREAPHLPGLDILGKTLPGREVGGDYLDFLEFPDGKLGLALGDATGMGIPAALLMAGVAQSFRAAASARRPVAEVLEAMNRDLVGSRHEPQFQGFFAAFFYGLLEPSSGLLTFCNAGMPTPWLFRRGGRLERLHRGGPLLGIQEEGRFRQGRVRIHPGDLLFVRSDGLEEQEDESGELFGEARVLAWMNRNQEWPVSRLGEELLSLVADFAGKASRDDISMILLRLSPVP